MSNHPDGETKVSGICITVRYWSNKQNVKISRFWPSDCRECDQLKKRWHQHFSPKKRRVMDRKSFFMSLFFRLQWPWVDEKLVFTIFNDSESKNVMKLGCGNTKHLFAYNLNCNTYRTHVSLVCDWCMWPTTNVPHICNIIKAVDSRLFLLKMDEKLPQL